MGAGLGANVVLGNVKEGVQGAMAQAQAARYNAMQMKFQAHQSNTAYQRTMADMSLAGLNPILASGATPAGGGSPNSAMQVQAVDQKGANSGLDAQQTGVNTAVAAKTQDNLVADTKLKANAALNYTRDSDLKLGQLANIDELTQNAFEDRKRIKAETDRISSAKKQIDYDNDQNAPFAAAGRALLQPAQAGEAASTSWFNSAMRAAGW